MTKAIKLLSIVFLTSALTACQSGPSVRSARSLIVPHPAETNSTQTANAFTSKLSPMLPLDFLNALNAQENLKVFPPVAESPIDTIDYTNTVDASAICLGSGNVDSDNDGLPDACDLEHYPLTYNGWLVSGRYFDSRDPRLTLTEQENTEWKKDSAQRGGVGFGNISSHAQKVVKKFSALKKLSDSDVGPLKQIFYNYSQEPIRISDNFKSYVRSNVFQSRHPETEYIGLASGDGDEAIPYSHAKPGTNVAGLTAFGKDTDSYREQGRFKMFVYETNVVIPKNSESLQVTIGHLSNDRFMIPPRTGMYYVINNGDSILLQNELLSDKGRDFQGSRFGTIYRDSGCATAHLIVVYITDGSKDQRGQPILPEALAFRENDKSKWFVPSQEYYSIQPQGGIACQQAFGADNVHDEKTFLVLSNGISRRVPGVVDFNPSLSEPGVSDPYRMLDADSKSIELIREFAEKKPVETMTPFQLNEYNKALFQLNKDALPASDQEWLKVQFDKIKKREESLDPVKLAQSQLTQLQELTGKLNGLDPASPEFAATSEQIDQLLSSLGKAQLNDEQKKTLADQTKAYNDRKAVVATPEPVANPKSITVSADKDATIALSADDVSKLKELGYSFKDAQGNDIPAGQGVNLTPAQLDSILAQSGEELAKGTLDQPKAKTLSALMDSLKKNKSVDPSKLDGFNKNYGQQLANATKGPKNTDPDMVTFDPAGTIKLTPKDMIAMKQLGFKFTDEKGNPYDPVSNPGKNKKITEDQFSDIMKRLGDRLEANQFENGATPKSVADFLTKMKGSGADAQNIDDFLAQHQDKITPMSVKWSPEQLEALAALDAETSKAKPGLTEDMKKWSKGFPDQSAADAAKKTALEKIEKSLLDPTKADFTTQEREVVVDGLKKAGFVDENKAEELKAKIGARAAFVDANGVYHPEYAFLITLVKASRPDGTTFSAFKFNSTINFETGSSKIDANGQNVINGFLNFVNTVRVNSKIVEPYFRVEAFTDATGTKEKNQQVSNSRAQTVKKYLLSQIDIPEDHVVAEGKGIDPIALGEPKKNGKYQPDIRFRRVEITFSAEAFTTKTAS